MMCIRVPVLFAVLAAALSFPAAGHSADLTPDDPLPVIDVLVEAPFSWSGFYGGVSIGYGMAGEDDVDATAFPDTDPVFLGTLAPQGVIGGVQAGYNWQRGNMVFGVETDIQASGVGDSSDAAAFDVPLGTSSTEVDWYGTLRARLGYAAGPNLFYATGGLAYGGLDATIAAEGPGGLNTVMKTSGDPTLGYAIGGGVEHAISARVSVRADYQFVHLAEDASGAVFDSAGNDTGVVGTSAVEANMHTVKIGLNFHF